MLPLRHFRRLSPAAIAMRSIRLFVLGTLLVVLATAVTFTADPASTAMASAATRWLDGLTAAQKQQAQFALDSAEWTRWHFIPSGPPPAFPRIGLTIKDMAPAQRELAHALLKTGLSQRGYLTATQIMELETTLGAMEAEMRARGERTPFVRDRELYFFSIFGTPAASGTWGWRVEGHHISLHFTVVNGTVTVSTPTFFGANPAEVMAGDKKGLRVLGALEDPARQLVTSLTDAQRAQAIVPGDAPNDILTTTKVPAEPLTPGGLPATAMTAPQRQLLTTIIEAYTSQMQADVAAVRQAHLRKAGADAITFAWAGGTARGQKHYYRVQGPTFLIEFDNTQNDGNHVHSVWRDFAGDFGRDLLREHLQRDHQ